MREGDSTQVQKKSAWLLRFTIPIQNNDLRNPFQIYNRFFDRLNLPHSPIGQGSSNSTLPQRFFSYRSHAFWNLDMHIPQAR